MSYNIPIILDDSPFFDWGEMRRPRGRRSHQSSARRQPSIFGQWAEPELFYDYPAKKQHNRPTYRGRETKNEPEKQSKMPEENRFIEDEEGGIYDTEEHRRVRQAPRDNFGWDGWDIPVQYGDRRTRPHHKHKQTTKDIKSHQDITNDSPGSTKQSQRKAKEASKNKETPSDAEIKTEHGKNAEAMKIKTGKQSSKVIPEDKMEQKFVDDPTTKPLSQTAETQNDENIEIPIAYSPPKNANRRHSKRLSQCDPPSPADIKLVRIKSIVQKTEGIEEKIKEFVDPLQNKNYLYISETLMKILLDLDNVDSEGFDIVRNARKEGVRTVQALVDKLENKLEENKIIQNQNS